MSCEHWSQVHQYHDGELPAGERDALEAHVKVCAECQALLNELRAMSRMLSGAPMVEIADDAMQRLRDVEYVAPDRGVLRIAEWLTAAAAAVLLVALPVWRSQPPVQPPTVVANADAVDTIEVTQPSDPDLNRNDYVALAQWISDDLSGNERR